MKKIKFLIIGLVSIFALSGCYHHAPVAYAYSTPYYGGSYYYQGSYIYGGYYHRNAYYYRGVPLYGGSYYGRGVKRPKYNNYHGGQNYGRYKSGRYYGHGRTQTRARTTTRRHTSYKSGYNRGRRWLQQYYTYQYYILA